MRHFIIQVKTTEIAPRHNLKCPKDSKYEEVEEPDKKIQQFLLWAHKTGLLAVWGPRRFVLSASAAPKFLTPRFAEFQGVVQALAAVSMDDFIAKDGMLQNLQNDLKYSRSDYDGHRWWTNWFTAREELKTPERVKEIDRFMESLFALPEMASLETMRQMCRFYAEPTAEPTEFNLYCDTDHFHVWLRLVTRQRDYNLYVHFYVADEK